MDVHTNTCPCVHAHTFINTRTHAYTHTGTVLDAKDVYLGTTYIRGIMNSTRFDVYLGTTCIRSVTNLAKLN